MAPLVLTDRKGRALAAASSTTPDPAAKPRRKRLAGGDARTVVLDAAEELLRSGGPQALRLGEIAAKAGLSHSNVLYHFDGMPDLEAQLSRRIAVRIASEVAEIYVRRSAGELPIELANQKLFDVMSSGESGQLVSWMMQVSLDADLSELRSKLDELCELIASHPALADVPRVLLRPEIARTVQLSVCAALGYGLIRSRYAELFGTSAETAAIPDLLSDLQRGRMNASLDLVSTALANAAPPRKGTRKP
jgi:AcrR family transcriptional regulator